MDKNLKLIILVGAGGVGVWLTWKYLYDNGYLQKWFPTWFAASPAAPVTPQPAAAASKILATVPGTNPPIIQLPGIPPVLITAPPATTPAACPPGQYMYNGQCVPTGSTCPTGQTTDPATGVCQAAAAAATATLTTMQQMQQAAGTDSLSTDQWCFFYTQATGSDCPVDPGSIPAQVYHDAGVYAVDGSIGADGTPNPGDRTTPTDIGTWYALMQNQNPGFALSGLGAFSRSRLAMEWAA